MGRKIVIVSQIARVALVTVISKGFAKAVYAGAKMVSREQHVKREWICPLRRLR